MRLHIGMVGAKQLLGAINRQLFHLIGKFLSAIVSTTGKALGILVGEDRPRRFHDGSRGVVLGGNQPDVLGLPARLGLVQVVDGGIPTCSIGLIHWEAIQHVFVALHR